MSGPSDRGSNANKRRDLALFNVAIDSKLRGCDIVSLRVADIAPHGYALDRATVRQKKTGRPVRFELTEQTRQAVDDYPSSSLDLIAKKAARQSGTPHLATTPTCRSDPLVTPQHPVRLICAAYA